LMILKQLKSRTLRKPFNTAANPKTLSKNFALFLKQELDPCGLICYNLLD
jgi:hypothetical protein